jgi:hypothetical protein
MPLDLDAIEQRAKAAQLIRGGELTVARESPWRVVCSDSESPDAVAACPGSPPGSALISHDSFAYDCCTVLAETAHETIAAHIAGLDPQTVLALVTELCAARHVVEVVKQWMALPYRALELGDIEARVLDALSVYGQALMGTAKAGDA